MDDIETGGVVNLVVGNRKGLGGSFWGGGGHRGSRRTKRAIGDSHV